MKLVNVILFLLIFPSIIFGQNKTSIQLREGLVKSITHGLPADLKKANSLSIFTQDIIISKSISVYDEYSLNAGVGGSWYRYTNTNNTLFENTKNSFYGLVKYGVNRKLNKKLNLDLAMFHYILAHNEKQSFIQRRVFTNIELGLEYQINNNFLISVSTPFTLHPFLLINTYTKDENEVLYYHSGKTRNYGITVALKYDFYIIK